MFFSPAYTKPPILWAFNPRFFEYNNSIDHKTLTKIKTHAESRSITVSPPLPEPPKRVHFSPIKHVILIPTRQEFIQAELYSKLWSSGAELSKFKEDALIEYFENNNLGLSPKKTLAFIYELDGVHPANNSSLK